MSDRIEAPYLVTLGLDPSTFERLDRLRAHYFPPELNLVPAHVSLFHHLPGDEGEAIAGTLEDLARDAPPISLKFRHLKRIGRGMAATVEGPGLSSFHASLARSFARWLTPQDRQPFRPHVTIMNKAQPAEAARAFEALGGAWNPFEGTGDAILLWRYRGGPWEAVDRFVLAGQPSSSGLDPAPTHLEG